MAHTPSGTWYLLRAFLCMLICIFAPVHTEPMTSLDLSGRGIGDEQIHDSAPLVRALVVQRLEQIWTVCEPNIVGTAGKPDPRWAEAGIRVLDRLARLYRLDSPVPGADQPEGDLVPRADLVLAGLRELEARMSGD
jgi:hypothetical protein